MKPEPRSVRARLTGAVTVLIVLVAGVAGLLIVRGADQRARADVDATLASRYAQITTTTGKSGKLVSDGSFSVRVVNGDKVSAQAGPVTGAPVAAREGYSTVAGTDGLWRSLSKPLKTGVQLQVLISLRSAQRDHSGNTRMVLLLVVLAALLGGLGTWYVTGHMLRPLRRLRDAVRELRPDDPGERLPAVTGPAEVAELTAAFNDLLDRLHAAEPRALHPVVVEQVFVEPPAQPEPQPASAPSLPPVLPPTPTPPPQAAPVLPPATVEVLIQPRLSADEERALSISLDTLGNGLENLLDDPNLPVHWHLTLAGLADEHTRLLRLLESVRPQAGERR